MLAAWTTAAALALATGAAAFTIARTKVTQPLRDLIKRHSTWLGNLISCPYCTSHWLAGAAVLIYRPRLTSPVTWVTDMGVAWLAVVAAAAFVIGRINASIKP